MSIYIRGFYLCLRALSANIQTFKNQTRCSLYNINSYIILKKRCAELTKTEGEEEEEEGKRRRKIKKR